MDSHARKQYVLPNGLKLSAYQTKVNTNDRVPSVPNFQPNLELLQRAARHRLGSATSCRSRCRSAKVERRKRYRIKSSNSESTSWGTDDGTSLELVESLTVSSETQRQLESDSVFDSDDSDVEQLHCWEINTVTQTQKTYRAACNKYHIKPNKLFDANVEDNELIVKDQGIGPAGTKACAMALTVNKNVRKLDYEGNAAGADGLAYMSDMLTENIYISDLNLANNQMCSEGLRCLVEAMESNDTIEKLNISANGFEESDGILVAELIKGNDTIRNLNLSHNNFREEGGRYIGESLGDNTCLENLDLSWNHLRRRGAMAISQGIGQNLGLQTINLSWNGWYFEGCRAMSRALTTNSTLLELDLTCNRIDKKCVDVLLKGLRKNESLLTLKISNNPIGREGAIAFVHVLEQIPSLPLTYLDISGQPVTTEFLRSLERVLLTRPLHIKHGVTLYYGGKAAPEFLHDDPMMVLMEFMRIKNLRLLDLFSSPDADSSRTITEKEFRDGLKAVNIPLSNELLNRLINKLDKNGDGEIDLSELIATQKKHKKRIAKLTSENESNNAPFEDTEIGSIHVKIKRLLAANEEMFAAKAKEKVQSTSQLKRNNKSQSATVRKDTVHETTSKVFPDKDRNRKPTAWRFQGIQ